MNVIENNAGIQKRRNKIFGGIMLINLSNHPSCTWSQLQRAEALKYGDIVDVSFPKVRAEASEEEIAAMAEEMVEIVLRFHEPVVMVQGEFTLTYAIVERLKKAGIQTVASCTDREVEIITKDNGVTEKRSLFKFVRFREY